ncbi:hypothetical protein AAMO2058_000321800 [Amorphochlora amoebiformis]
MRKSETMALNLSEPRIRRNSLSISSSNQNSRTYTPRRSQSAGPESSKGSSKTSTARTRRSAITRITVTDPKGKSLVSVISDSDPLVVAAKGSDAKKLKALLEAMDPHKRTLKVNQFDKMGSTLLFHPAWRGNLDMIKVLLDYDADPNIQNNRLNTPLHLAVERQHTEVMLCLVDHGADIMLQNWDKKRTFENDQMDPRTAVEFEKMLRSGREKYLEVSAKDILHNITEEERSKYKTMYDTMDENLDGYLTAFEMHRLFHYIPPSDEYKDLGIEHVTHADIREFHNNMNCGHNPMGLTWRDFLTYVHTFKTNEAREAAKRKKLLEKRNRKNRTKKSKEVRSSRSISRSIDRKSRDGKSRNSKSRDGKPPGEK